MTEACDPIRDLLAPYALGALPHAEQALVESHVDGCATCGVQLRSYQDATVAMAAAMPMAEPPADLRRRILKQLPNKPGVPAARGGFWRVPPLAMAAAAVALVLVGGILALQLVLMSTLGDLRSENDAMAESLQLQRAVVYMAAAPGTSVATLKGQATKPDAYGMFMRSATGRNGYLMAANMTPLSGDQVYKAWLIDSSGTTEGTGTFDVDPTGWAVLQVRPKSDGDMLHYSAFAVSVEGPSTVNATKPSTDPVLLGALQ